MDKMTYRKGGRVTHRQDDT